MQCPSCRRVLEGPAVFCGDCGLRVRRVCEGCGQSNILDNAFCERCGRNLASRSETSERASTGSGRLAPNRATVLPERRHLTVVFCDLVDSTELGRHLDPEDLRDVIADYQAVCAEAIQSYEGEIAQLLGDGLLVYFGYPQAREDDPIRAVDAALAILASLPSLNARLAVRVPALRGNRVEVRIGVHTGPVVVSDMGGGEHRERLALGDTVNLAARLQGAAAADSVVISDATRALVGNSFTLEDLGHRPFKGIAEPLALHRVLGSSSVRYQYDRTPESELTPFVGRERELGTLLDRWQRVVSGSGQVVAVHGDPGIGKSRLLTVFGQRLSDTPHYWLEGRCSRYHRNSAFYPLVQLLRRALGFAPDDSAEERVAKLEHWVEVGGLDASEAVPLLTDLLDLGLPERYERPRLSPDVKRKRTLELVPLWLAGLARERPLVLVIEDLHWIDPSTLELLEAYLKRRKTPAILVLLTFRPEFEPPWKRSRHTELGLRPLEPSEAAALVGNVAQGNTLPPEILDQVVAKTDGVPLFVEELTKNVLESDLLVEEGGLYRRTAPGPELEIPSTLQASLMERLDRLGSAKEVAQLAAVVGREFGVELLAAVSPWTRKALEQALDQLEGIGLVRRRSGAVYVFKHALIQDAAYQSQLRSQRRSSHARIAEALEAAFPEQIESEPELIARHCEAAGLERKARAYYERAGRRALDRSAHTEAVAHLRKGIDLLGSLEETSERTQQELSMQTALGQVLLAVRGWGNPEVEQTHARARDLCREVGDGPQLFQSMAGLFLFYLTRGDLELAAELADEIARLAERLDHPYYAQWAQLFGGLPLHYRGQWEPALAHFEAAIEIYGGDWRTPEGIVVETDQGVASHCMAGQAHWMLGRPDLGLTRTLEAVEIGRKSHYPNNLAFALVFSTTMYQLRRDRERSFAEANEVVRVAEEQGFPMWLGMGKVFRGWALAEGSTGERGLAEIVEGLSQLATTGARLTGPQVLALLAEVYANLGRFKEASGAVESGLGMAREQGVCFWDSELHRLRGEILLHLDPRAEKETEACFERSRELAVGQRSLSFALRTATSTARLRHRQGRQDEARVMLGKVCEQVREGQATRDVLDATALLGELGAASDPRA